MLTLQAQALVVTTAVDEDLNPGTGLSLREALANEVDGGTITEYNNGTDPFNADNTDPNITLFDADPTAGELVLTWETSPLTSYDIRQGSSLGPWMNHSSHVTDDNDLSFTHTISGWNFVGKSNAFFHIRKTP